MICRIRCKACGRTWVFDTKFLNPAEYSCPFHKEDFMSKHKTLHVTPNDGSGARQFEASTVEQGLRDIAKAVKKGELTVPFTLSFDGPAGLQFTVTVATEEQAGEMQTMGFMF